MSYIYVIENDINDKKYVGKTNFSIEKRFQEHLRDSDRVRMEKRPLYNAMQKYGKEHFSIRELEEVSPEKAEEREIFWIEFYHSYQFGYNATLGGDGKTLIDYKKILKLFDTTSLSQGEIAAECNCSKDSVQNIVSQYRENVNWMARFSYRHITNNNGITGMAVLCVENGKEFPSCTAAASWLVDEGKIKSQAYGRNHIPDVCRGKRQTLGGFHWKFI